MSPIEPTPWYTSRTIITSVVLMVLTIVELFGIEIKDFPLDRIIDGLMAIGLIYISYLRLEPSQPKPLTQAQANQLTQTALNIVAPVAPTGS
jgi:hypothetical protein